MTHTKELPRQGRQRDKVLLPKSWIQVAGLLKGQRRIDPLRYQRTMRRAWEERLKKQLRITP